jgi:integrase
MPSCSRKRERHVPVKAQTGIYRSRLANGKWSYEARHPVTKRFQVAGPRLDDAKALRAKLTTAHFKVIVVTEAQALRKGEVVGLRWQDVDFQAGMLTISEQLRRNGKTATPKGNKPATIRLLEPARKVLLRRWFAAGQPATGSVFDVPYTRLDAAFRRVRNQAGLSTDPRPFEFHDLRHTGVSRLANKPGAVLVQVRDFARHSSLAITEQYMHSNGSTDWMEEVAS